MGAHGIEPLTSFLQEILTAVPLFKKGSDLLCPKLLISKHSLTCSFAFSKGGVKGEGIGECSDSNLPLTPLLWGSLKHRTTELSLQPLRGFRSYSLSKVKGLFINSPCEGLTDTRQVLYRNRQLAVFSARLRSNG